MKNFWKSIYAHTWTDAEYKSMYNILNGKQMPKSLGEKKRAEIYSIDPEKKRIVLEYTGNLPWNIKNGIAIVGMTQQQHVFNVAKPNEKKEIIEAYFKSAAKLTVGKNNLHDKIIRDKWLGISRSNVGKILKEHDIRKKSLIKFKKPIIQSYRPLYPLQHWQVDLIDMTNVADEGYKWILVVIDIFSKFTYAFALKNKQNDTIAIHLENIFLTGDIPDYIQTDNDGSLTRSNVKKILDDLKIYQIVNPSYSPQTNGFVENKVKLIKKYIKLHFDTYNTKLWKSILSKIVYNINTSKHEVTGFTPLQIHRGINHSRISITSVKEDMSLLSAEEKEEEQKIIKEYVKEKEKEEIARTLYIKNVIHKTANKREQKARKQVWTPDIGDYVLIPKYISDGKYQSMVLQVKYDKEIKQINPNAIVRKTSFISKMDTTFIDAVFQVKEKTKDTKNGRYYYTLTTRNKKGIVQYKYDATGVSSKFYPEMMYPYTDYYTMQKEPVPISPLKKITLTKEEIETILENLPINKEIKPNLYIKLASTYQYSNKTVLQWDKGRVIKKTKRQNLPYDVYFVGYGTQQMKLVSDYYSYDNIDSNWYFLEEKKVGERYIAR